MSASEVLPRPAFGGHAPDGLATVDDLLAGLDAATIGYAVTDADGRVLSASAPYKRIAAVSDGKLMIGEPWYELDTAGAEEKAMRGALWRAFRAGGTTWKGWVRWHMPSGRVRYFEGTARPLDGERTLLIANDRSDRIEADRALEESEESLRVILNDLPVNVTILDPSGLVLYINKVLPERLGVTPDDVIGRPFDAIDGVSPDPHFSAQLKRAIKQERRTDGLAINLTKGTLADTHWVFFGRPLYARDGRMQRYLTVSVERTAEQRLAEERARFTAALAESQKVSALNDFAGSLAHELANVLQPVGVYARRLAREPGGPDAGDHAHKIDAAVRDASRILRRTLSMARTEAGAPQRVDLASLTAEVVESARDLAPKALTYEVALPQTVRGLCQATELRQVLLNLLNNAAEAQSYQGVVRVRMSGPGLTPTAAGGPAPTGAGPFWRLEVQDTGRGMTKAVLARVFEPFFTTKGAGRGTGLGLPVVLGLVTGWGGTVTVESQPGTGTTFTVWIPTGDKMTREGEPERGAP